MKSFGKLNQQFNEKIVSFIRPNDYPIFKIHDTCSMKLLNCLRVRFSLLNELWRIEQVSPSKSIKIIKSRVFLDIRLYIVKTWLQLHKI